MYLEMIYFVILPEEGEPVSSSGHSNPSVAVGRELL